MGKWFGRDPAVVVAQVVSLFIAIILLISMPAGLSAALTAVVIASGGVVTALAVLHDGQIPALLGLAKAGLALAVILGAHLTETYQGLILAAIEQLLALAMSFRTTARLDVQGLPRVVEGAVPSGDGNANRW